MHVEKGSGVLFDYKAAAGCAALGVDGRELSTESGNRLGEPSVGENIGSGRIAAGSELEPRERAFGVQRRTRLFH
jgi:hypothetical protein